MRGPSTTKPGSAQEGSNAEAGAVTESPRESVDPVAALGADAADGSGEEVVAGPRSVLRRRWPALVVSVALGACFVWLLEAGALPVIPSAEVRGAVRWWAVPAYTALYALLLLVRAVRFHWLVAPLYRMRLGEVVGINWVFFGALLLLPFRMGEAVRPALARREGKLSLWQGFGMVGAERVIDGFVSSAVLLAALVLARPRTPLPDHIGALPVPVALVPRLAYGMLAVFGAAFVAIALFYGWRGLARRLTERSLGLVSRRLGIWVADRVEHVAEGLRFLPRWRYAFPFLAATLAFWALNVLSLWILMLGCGLDGANLAQASAVIGVLALGTLLPGAPGFFGTFQLSVYAGLAMYFAPETVVGPGAAVVFWMYTVQLVLVVGGGLIALPGSLRHQR